jgi:hypothetical protein
MIIIKDMDFEMEQLKTTPFFDLKMPTVINAGKDNERTEMKLVGYGMPFHTCLQHIVPYKLNKLDKTFSVIEYMQAYIKVVDEIGTLVQFLAKTPKVEESEDGSEEVEEEVEQDDI